MAAQRDPYESPAIRAFATELEAWRTQAGLNKTELAERLGYTPQYLGQLEAAKNIPSKEVARDLDTFFQTNGVFMRLWKLINDTRHLAALPPGFPDFVQREAAASMMYIFAAMVIHGLFQTQGYAHGLLKGGRSADETEALVAKRMERQEILLRKRPPNLVVIFDEGAVRRMVGGREVMREQYERLIEVAQMPHVTLQIVPSDVGAYEGVMGAFTMLGFDAEPDLVYTEGHAGGELTGHRATVQTYRLSYDLIRGAAMSADSSLRVLYAALENM